MHRDRLRFLIKSGKWSLDEIAELVRAAPDLLRQLDHAANTIEECSRAAESFLIPYYNRTSTTALYELAKAIRALKDKP